MPSKRKTWQEKLADKDKMPKILILEKSFPCYNAVRKMGAEAGDPIVLVNPKQMFLMGGISSPERWEELSAIYESLQASVAFFEPGTSQPESVQPQGEEIRQWAKTAYASSSYDSPDWNASQATGAPDVLADECEDSPLSWAG